MDDDGNRVIGKVFGGMGNNHLSYHFFLVLKEVEAFVACRRGSVSRYSRYSTSPSVVRLIQR